MLKCLRYGLLALSLPFIAHANLQEAIQTNRYSEVITLLNQQLEKTPDDGSSLFLKAMYSKSLKLDDAKASLDRLKQAQPDYARCFEDLSKKVEQKLDTRLPNPLDHAAILTLGSPVDDSGQPGQQLLERLKKTLSLAQTYPMLPIIVSGSAVYSRHDESKVMKQWLIEHGLHPERIIRENKARNTVENIKNSLQLLPNETDRVLLVTNQSHIKRAFLIFDAVLINSSYTLEILPAPGPDHLSEDELKERKLIEKASSYRDRARTMGYLQLHDGLAEVLPCTMAYKARVK